jgi:hypothetical protein
MKNMKLNLRVSTMIVAIIFITASCSNDESVDVVQEDLNVEEVAQSLEIDQATAALDDISLEVFEVQEQSESNKGPVGERFNFLPNCVTVTVVAEQGHREITMDFGNGCEIRGNTLVGKIIMTYTRNKEERNINISKTFEGFSFNYKQIVGTKSILKQWPTDGGYPVFTKSVDIAMIWPDGAEASRQGIRVKEWVEGFRSGIWSDNVFEVTGSWTTTFRNGNTHSVEVLKVLRREAVCKFFVSGSMYVDRPNRSGVLDFGDGDCDNKATFTTNDGEVKEIILR